MIQELVRKINVRIKITKEDQNKARKAINKTMKGHRHHPYYCNILNKYLKRLPFI
jgi:hypothetical protein